ncbi:MAG TPA: ComF family protein [Firmicutes bacterium]|nr:ComF family protein [Bacillota bacterium]
MFQKEKVRHRLQIYRHLTGGLARVREDFGDLLFPPPAGCGYCGSELMPPLMPWWTPENAVDQTLCRRCLEQVVFTSGPGCARCGRPEQEDRLCVFCRNDICRVSGGSATVYEGIIPELTRRLKFKGARQLAAALGRMAAITGMKVAAGWPVTAVVPVPLHQERLAERGYNQAQLIAGEVARWLGRPLWSDILLRTRNTKPQSGLDIADRAKNIEGAFVAVDVKNLSRRSILLVDDVLTTGATLTAAAAALLVAGAGSVRFVTASVTVAPPQHWKGDY